MINSGVVIEGLEYGNLLVEKGMAKAILPEERQKSYYKWAETGIRDYLVALEERIRHPFENGLLVVRNPDGSVKFDDRKLRVSGYSKQGDSYILRIAPTHFGEIKGTDVKAAMDQNYEESLLERGLLDFNDPMAYFACSVAVNAVPITSEGSIHVFRRSDKQELFPGKWDVTGGFVDVGDQIFNLHKGDMSQKFRDLLYHNTRKEFVEESGSDHSRFELTGLVKGANYVFTHRAFLDITSEDYDNKLGIAVDSSEAGRHLILPDKNALVNFLESEEGNTSPTAYHALRFHLNRL